METKPRSPSLLPSPLPESLAGTKLNITDHTFTDQTPPQSIQKECKAKRKLNFDDQVSVFTMLLFSCRCHLVEDSGL